MDRTRYAVKKFAAILAAFLFIGGATVDCAEEGRLVQVHRVLDGDTFEIEGGESVRLDGINTPEYRPWENEVQFYGKEASAFTKELLHAKRVRLVQDIKKRDKYDRTLAYAFLQDGRFVNQILVEEGYARAKYYPPNGRYYFAFKLAQDKARKSKKGLWARP